MKMLVWVAYMVMMMPCLLVVAKDLKSFNFKDTNNNVVQFHNAGQSSKPVTVPNWKASDYQSSEPCSSDHCKLPNCFCGGRNIPGGLKKEAVPQMILVTFDDSVNLINWNFYNKIFGANLTNPNGCPIQGTFYVSHEWTDYSAVQSLYERGNEIASHSISHSNGANFSLQRWFREIEGEKRILSRLSNVPISAIKGMRAPFLQPGGNNQYAMLHGAGFTYDSTLTTGDPSMWPYTLEHQLNRACRLAPCPTKSFPGLWEVPLAMLSGSNGRACSMADSCLYGETAESVANVFMKNFLTHYNGNRAPLGLYFHYAFFATHQHRREGFLLFVDRLLKGYKDVYFVTTSQALDWIRHPIPVEKLGSWDGWKCSKKVADTYADKRPCFKPNTCVLRFRNHDRYIRTCSPCPERYPWYDNINGE